MTDPFLKNCGGFTPVPDELANNYGFESAYLWGKLRRFCQLDGGTYTASHEAIGNRIGMSRRNLIDRLNILIKDGYVEDLTPGVRNRAHTYSVKKGEAKILAGMQISHTESDMQTQAELSPAEDTNVGMRNLHTSTVECAENAQQNGTGMQNLPSQSAEFAHPELVGMQNLHLKRDKDSLKQESNPSKESKRGVAPPENSNMLAPHTQALMTICKLDWEFVKGDKPALGAFNRIRDFLIKKGATTADIAEFDVWRRTHHWTGNSPPTLKQVGEYWPQYQEWVTQGRPESVAVQTNKQNGANQNGNHQGKRTQQFNSDSPPAGIGLSTWQKLERKSPG